MRQERGPVAAARPVGARDAGFRNDGPAPSRLTAMVGPAAIFARRRPGLVLAVCALVGSGGLIGWNALNQANRHPAPLFRPKPVVQAAAPRRVETPVVAPLAAPAPIPVPRPDPITVGSVQVPPPPAPPVLRASAPAGDPIGNLIRGGGEPASKITEPRPDPRVAAVQKALTKAGYGPLKADGVLGTTTRQALERFERDNHLPVTGGLGTRTTRQLASASGTQIE